MINAKQIAAVLSLPAPQRYAHFVKVVADRNRMWGLYCEGWALMGAEEGVEVFPVWPAEEYALACATGTLKECAPRAIDLESFFGELLPSLRRSGTLLGVFPTPSGKGMMPSLDQVEGDIRSELRRYE